MHPKGFKVPKVCRIVGVRARNPSQYPSRNGFISTHYLARGKDPITGKLFELLSPMIVDFEQVSSVFSGPGEDDIDSKKVICSYPWKSVLHWRVNHCVSRYEHKLGNMFEVSVQGAFEPIVFAFKNGTDMRKVVRHVSVSTLRGTTVRKY